ncbi:MAG: prephenate dehydratase [Desulfobacterales bacterium]
MTSEKKFPEERIDSLRSVIDDIDEKLLDLINRRLLTAKEIGQVKSMKQLQVQNRTRERQVLGRLDRLNHGPIKTDDLHHLFMEIIGITREIQSSGTIGYLGPEATLTHIAALQHFGHNAPLKAYPSILDVFRDVEREGSRYGVVPVEDAVEGAVHYALEYFLDSNLRICGERCLMASCDLLARDGSLADVKEIHAHAHSLAQSRAWIRKHLPDAEIRECHTTAEAVAMASGRSGAAAIGSSAAAGLYGLKTVSASIEDTPRNLTRFLIIGKDEMPPTGSDRTTILFVTSNVPGALLRALKPLDEEGVNMVKLESRPGKMESWNCLFFADLEGHESDAEVAAAIEKMKARCLFLKVIGAYPSSPFEGSGHD